MTNAAQELIAQATAATEQAKRGRKPLLENRDNIINALKALSENDADNMPSRRTLDQLAAMDYVTVAEKERAEGQRGRTGKTYELSGKGRSWLALQLRNRAKSEAKQQAETLAKLRDIVAQRKAALAEAETTLANFEEEIANAEAAAQAEREAAEAAAQVAEEPVAEQEPAAEDEPTQEEVNDEYNHSLDDPNEALGNDTEEEA